VVERLVDDGEPVTAAQVPVEVDVGGEDVGDLDGYRVGQGGGVGGRKERAPDIPRTLLDPALQLNGLLGYCEGFAATIDARHRGAVHVAQGDQLALGRRPRAHGPARNHAVKPLRGPVGAQVLDGVGIVYPESGEQRAQRIVAAYALLAPEPGIRWNDDGRGRK